MIFHFFLRIIKKVVLLRTLLRVKHCIVDYVAQQVEHIPFKDGVLGSSPSVVTKKTSRMARFFYF